MSQRFFAVFCFSCLFLLSGCLPWGTPPEGKIVQNPTALQPMTQEEAVDLAVTSLGAWSIAHAPGAAVRIAGQSDTEVRLAADVLREAGKLSGIYASPAGRYQLSVQINGRECSFLLSTPAEKIVWQEKYPLRKASRE